MTATPNILWPPDNRLRDVLLKVVSADNCGPATSKVIGVVSSEIPGPREPKWRITGDLAVKLPASRLGAATGRTYTITVECRDHAGNNSTRKVTATVPHDQREQ